MRYFFHYYKKFYIPLIFVAIFSILSYYMLFDSIISAKQNIININEEKTKIASYQLRDYFNEKIRLAKTLGQIISSMEKKDFRNDEIRNIIEHNISNYKDIKDFGLSDEHGKLKIYINNKKNDKKEESLYVGEDIAFRDYFKKGLSGEYSISVMLKDIITGEEIVIISAPYYDYKDKFKGVVILSINRDKVSKLLSSYNRDSKEYTVMVDENSKIFVHPKLIEARRQCDNAKFLKNISKNMLSNNVNTIQEVSTLDNQAKLMSYKKVEGTPWGIIYVKHISKLYMPLVKQFIINLNILFVALIIIHLILRSYFLQIKREEDFLVYNTERIEILGRISAGIAHEIRNPLSTIKGYVQMNHLQNPTELSMIALTDLNRIEKTLNQFLKLYKPLEEDEEIFYPYEVIDELSTIVEAIGLLKDIDIEYNVEKDLKVF